MEFRFIILLIVSMATLCSSDRGARPSPPDSTSNVMQFGAKGDGITDDSQAFIKAWGAVCGAASSKPTLVVPKGKRFLLQPATFQGPCKSPNLHFQIDGDIVAPKAPSAWKEKGTWLNFQRVTGFSLEGNGKIDGQGSQWWSSRASTRPTVLSFNGCTNFKVNGLNIMNSPRNHISVSGCDHGTFSDVHLTSPEKSPNTDGVDIAHSKNIRILGGNFRVGDDCIAINTGCSAINITGLACGPGHGLSIGSLGHNGESAAVEDVHVTKCTLTSTQNGLRIKTWQGGAGYARKITFADSTLVKVGNPIIIDQFYCPHSTCHDQGRAVKVSDVSFTGIHGTTTSRVPISLNCSKTVGCSNVVLRDINITPAKPMKVHSVCINAHGKAGHTNPTVDCLKS